MKKLYILVVCLLSLLACFVVGYQLGKKNVSEPIMVRIHDSIPVDIPVPVVEYKEIPQKIDTAAILRNYYAEKKYDDTIINLPELKVSVSDMITENNLTSRTVMLDYNRISPEDKKRSFLIGTMLGKQLQVAYAGYQYKSITYKAGYDFYNKSLIVGFSKDIYKW